LFALVTKIRKTT